MTRTTIADRSFPQHSKKEHVSGVRPLDERGREGPLPFFGGIRLAEAITIGKPVSEVYAYWRDLRNLPRFCKQLRHVEVLDDRRSRWTANGPDHSKLVWEAELIEDRSNELISWRSMENSEFENAGSVTFRSAPGGRGTEVRLSMTYNPPGGPLGSLIAKMSAKDPAFLLREQLRRLKQLLETGEIATTAGQSAVIED